MLNGRWYGIGYESIDAGKYFFRNVIQLPQRNVSWYEPQDNPQSLPQFPKARLPKFPDSYCFVYRPI